MNHLKAFSKTLKNDAFHFEDDAFFPSGLRFVSPFVLHAHMI